MARGRKPLTALEVKALKAPGRYSDGRNLYLAVSKSGTKSYTLVYVRDGKQREMGLGSAATVTLVEARAAAMDANRLLAQGKSILWRHEGPLGRPGAASTEKAGLAAKLLPAVAWLTRAQAYPVIARQAGAGHFPRRYPCRRRALTDNSR